MLSIRNNISAKVVCRDDKPTESFYVEFNFRKKKWLMKCSYNSFQTKKDYMRFQLFVQKCLINMLLKSRYIRSNHKPFINNETSKAIMTTSKLRNRFLQNRSEENRKLFRKQRNKCVSLLQGS